jgi:hypothetical protein
MLDMKDEQRWIRLALVTKILKVAMVLIFVAFLIWLKWGR